MRVFSDRNGDRNGDREEKRRKAVDRESARERGGGCITTTSGEGTSAGDEESQSCLRFLLTDIFDHAQ